MGWHIDGVVLADTDMRAANRGVGGAGGRGGGGGGQVAPRFTTTRATKIGSAILVLPAYTKPFHRAHDRSSPGGGSHATS